MVRSFLDVYNRLTRSGAACYICPSMQIGDDVEVTVVLEDDGTVIDSDSVFKQLPQQTVFVFLEDGQTWNGGRETLGHLLFIKRISMNFIWFI